MTGKQNAFVIEYLKDLNATQAAIRAKYPAKSAYSAGQRLLKSVEIQKAIAEQQRALQTATGITAAIVIKEFARIALADISQAFDANGNLLPIKDIPEEVRRAISGVEITEEFTGTGESRVFGGYTKKIKFWDKVKALENLGKIIGVYIEDNKQKADGFKAMLDLME